MRNYRIESLDPRDDTIINIDDVKADFFILDDDNITVTFCVGNSDNTMSPVAMYPFKYVVSINSEPTEEGDTE